MFGSDEHPRRCFLNWLSLGALALLAVACGGGGGSEPVASTSACIAAAGESVGGSNSARLAWEAVTHANFCGYRVYYVATSLPTEYLVERCGSATCSNFVEVAKLAGTSYNDTNLEPNTSYRYRVRAADSAGSLSGYSTVASDTTLTGTTLTPGLVAAYAFNEGTGTAVSDASGNNNNTLTNGPAWTSGRFGNALEFDGAGARVTVPHSASLNLTTAMTLEAWVYPATAAPNVSRVVISKNDNDGYFLLSASSSNNLPATGGTFAGGGQITFAPATLAVGKWTHLATTFDGATVRLFVNGNEVASQVQITPLLPTTGTLRIGGDPPARFFAGRIDEVRIYNRALSEAEIQADMNTAISSDVTPPAPPAALTAAGATAMQINLAWNASADPDVSSYRIERCMSAACGNFFEVATGSGTTYVDTTALLPETTYGYQVRAVDAAGNSSAPSNIAYTSTLASGTILPTAPGGLTAVAASSTQINLTWGVSTSAPGTYVQSIGQGINAGNTTTYTVTGLISGARYYFAVTAFDTSNSESGFSNVVYKDIP